ncbi:MAG: hypothetical protein KatS3mg119_2359 [Rhodothalassiaceae bacterium]|nr:MAG: hypothetical protein KatS3mg119_2359 [Rhodothalassiaceae bacterium]
MRPVVILHAAAPGRPDEDDTLVAVAAVAAALARAGRPHRVMRFAGDPASLAALADEGAVVFNLVESFLGRDALAFVAPALLEAFGVPFTGCGAEALLITTDKPFAKRLMRAAGIPTPDWGPPEDFAPDCPVIMKPRRADGSLGLGPDAVMPAAAAAARLRRMPPAERAEWFVERFIEGREFNLAMIGGDRPRFLPASEIVFEDWPAGRPRILDYEAKWRPDAPAWRQSPRRFLDPVRDARRIAAIEALGEACWRLFGLKGCARIDLREDADGGLQVLEVNANPGLAPDAGLAAAATAAGMDYDGLVAEILTAAEAQLAAAAPGSASDPSPSTDGIVWRREARPGDPEAVATLLAQIGHFTVEEVAIGRELVEARLAGGPASGYEFVFAEDRSGRLLGYACWGRVPGSENSFDLYWIAVADQARGRGLGSALLARVEEEVVAAGGRLIVAETSGRALYASTRAFYERRGFRRAAVIENFYRPGDDKVIYVKRLDAHVGPAVPSERAASADSCAER